MRTITAKLHAYISSEHSPLGPHELEAWDGVKIIDKLSFYSADMPSWTKVGSAIITVDLIDTDELVLNRVSALTARLQKERADCELRCNAILEQISQLQAITHVKEEA